MSSFFLFFCYFSVLFSETWRHFVFFHKLRQSFSYPRFEFVMKPASKWRTVLWSFSWISWTNCSKLSDLGYTYQWMQLFQRFRNVYKPRKVNFKYNRIAIFAVNLIDLMMFWREQNTSLRFSSQLGLIAPETSSVYRLFTRDTFKSMSGINVVIFNSSVLNHFLLEWIKCQEDSPCQMPNCCTWTSRATLNCDSRNFILVYNQKL